MALNVDIFKKNEFRLILNKLEELLSHSKVVLLGAGASFCAGLPLTNQLTQKALESDKLSGDSKKYYIQSRPLSPGLNQHHILRTT